MNLEVIVFIVVHIFLPFLMLYVVIKLIGRLKRSINTPQLISAVVEKTLSIGFDKIDFLEISSYGARFEGDRGGHLYKSFSWRDLIGADVSFGDKDKMLKYITQQVYKQANFDQSQFRIVHDSSINSYETGNYNISASDTSTSSVSVSVSPEYHYYTSCDYYILRDGTKKAQELKQKAAERKKRTIHV